jgi:DNA-binding sugar fermentation-stimulating protein
VDQNIEDGKSNPMAVEVKGMPVLHEGKVAFPAQRFRERSKKRLTTASGRRNGK